MFAFRDALGPVDLAFTDRFGGSGASTAGAPDGDADLDLGVRAPAANLEAVMAAFAPDSVPALMRQVHGAVVDRVHERPHDAQGRTEPAEADAIVTTGAETLVVRVADCVPVLLAAPDAGLVGAVHAGRPGVEQGVLLRALEEMERLGASRMHAWIGPHVCGACYEVPADLQERVAAAEPATRATTSWGTPSLDLGAGVRAQLTRHDVTVHDAARCTRESADLHSYRRDGERAGRFAGLIRRRA